MNVFCLRRVRIALIPAFLLFATSLALAADTARLELPSADKIKWAGKAPVRGLKWKSQELEVRSGYSKGGADHYVVLEGNYERPFYKLYYQLEWQTSPTEIVAGQPFSFEVPYTGPTTLVQIIAVNPSGVSEGQTFHVVFPDATQKAEQNFKGTPSRMSFSPSLGLTYSSLTQSNNRSLNQTLLTFKAGYSYLLAPPKWDLGVGLYFSLMSLKSSVPNTWARFLGANLRLGYSIPLGSKWTLGIMGGSYYTTMFVSKSAKIGFENLMGPQIFPTLKYALNEKVSFGSYFKFSGVSSRFKLNGFGDREIAAGLSYVRTMESGKPFIVSTDFSTLHVTISNVQINSKSASLSAGVGF